MTKSKCKIGGIVDELIAKHGHDQMLRLRLRLRAFAAGVSVRHGHFNNVAQYFKRRFAYRY